MNKIIGFDLEIYKEIQEGKDWKDLRPLGISCASGYINEEFIMTWYSGWLNLDENYQTENRPMLASEIDTMLHLLSEFQQKDWKIATWNGLSFDFQVLAEEAGRIQECSQLAMNHIDMMFQIFCIKGYPVGLDAVAKGVGLEGKLKDMSGALAPVMWKGTAEDRDKVLEYVLQDAKTTLEIYMFAEEHKYLKWTSKSGKMQSVAIPQWLTVKECLELPLPDTSWMTNPMTRESMYSWCKQDE